MEILSLYCTSADLSIKLPPIVYAGFDHAGKELAYDLMKQLASKEILVLCPQLEWCSDHAVISYPAIVPEVVFGVLEENAWGILVCGSGIGMSIAANRYLGIRAALCRDTEDAVFARQHNHANILVLGARKTQKVVANACLQAFYSTECEGGRHLERVHMLDHLPVRKDPDVFKS